MSKFLVMSELGFWRSVLRAVSRRRDMPLEMHVSMALPAWVRPFPSLWGFSCRACTGSVTGSSRNVS